MNIAKMHTTVVSVSVALLFATSAAHALSLGMRLLPVQKCTALEMSACSQLGYNKTRIIPQMYLSTRRSELFEYFGMLSLTKCSKDLLFFVCMMYQPICFEDYNARILPCRSVCEDVKGSCLQTITKFGFQWPDDLNCDSLPHHNTGVCIKPSAIIKNEVNKNVDLKEKLPSENSVELPASSCQECKKSKELTRFKSYKKADFVVKGILQARSIAADDQTKFTFEVFKIYKKGNNMKSYARSIDIWSKTPCTCPQLKFDQVYFILVNEDATDGKLWFNERAIIQPYSTLLEKKMRKYSKKYEAVLLKRRARKQKMLEWILAKKQISNKSMP